MCAPVASFAWAATHAPRRKPESVCALSRFIEALSALALRVSSLPRAGRREPLLPRAACREAGLLAVDASRGTPAPGAGRHRPAAPRHRVPMTGHRLCGAQKQWTESPHDCGNSNVVDDSTYSAAGAACASVVFARSAWVTCVRRVDPCCLNSDRPPLTTARTHTTSQPGACSRALVPSCSLSNRV